ncbi:phosphoribosylamine--glycine ligase [Desulfogranum japonicum]|uniref:phosphoribosylamine--glycine ligase n=1 Tax=Desulfogranum japonicum TaxID=231447 RepID=UPI0003F735DA|nr:phosphoribosylamine--glycine ligase [Desulfogranum japonicum]
MKVLVIGSGGREHAIVWKLNQSKKVQHVYCAPGNAGIAGLATCVDIAAGDVEALVEYAEKQSIDLTIVGPEDPLTRGIVDLFEAKGMRIFGPSQAGAILEGSKAFTKDFLHKYHIPSAAYKVFSKAAPAKKFIDTIGAPCVVKADGLAAGKGVIVAQTKKEAKSAVDLIMKDKAFGEAGQQLVVEAFLQGEEASFIAFTDGTTVLPLPSSQDHKAANEGDKGPNTGGMGAYSPAPIVDEAMTKRVMEEVMLPTVEGMAKEGRPYKGMLYAGLMIDGDEINVLEFNCRFGDPECQPLLMRMQTDLIEVIEHCIDGTLDQIELAIDPRPTVCVVMASEGYPGSYDKGHVINGLAKAQKINDVEVFHAGTKMDSGKIVTNGGRVLGVTAIGEDIAEAIDRAYQAVDEISWTGHFFRRDIGHKALKRLTATGEIQVSIIMGSDSDLPIMQAASDILDQFGITNELRIASAHRTPHQVADYAANARENGIQIIIAGAGMSAHLAGVIAAHTTVPVIGVPIDASSLNGLDALLSTVQMPPGIPVATMGIGKAGAKNAAILAARILSLSNPALKNTLDDYVKEMEEQVIAKNNALQANK